MATAPKFRIDVDIHNLLMNTAQTPAKPVLVKGRKSPDPVFPRFPEKLVVALKSLKNKPALPDHSSASRQKHGRCHL